MIRYVVTISATQFATKYQSRMLKLIVSLKPSALMHMPYLTFNLASRTLISRPSTAKSHY
jgi:hypothetical protein